MFFGMVNKYRPKAFIDSTDQDEIVLKVPNFGTKIKSKCEFLFSTLYHTILAFNNPEKEAF